VLIVDLIIVGLILGMVAWGFSQGLTVRMLALAGFVAGVVIGSRVAPLVLEDGLESTYAPIIALPAALLAGGLLAALFERFGLRVRGGRERLGVADGVAGAVLAGILGLATAWIVGAIVTQMDSLQDDVERSEVLHRLNSALPPPGPVLAAEAQPADPIPTFEGKPPRVGPPNPLVARDPDVKRAERSLVKVIVNGCGHGRVGSGWIAAEGIVATNAHVVAGADATAVQVRGEGRSYAATPVWYDKKRDFALLRSAGVRGVAVLPLVPRPKGGAQGATLGFPRNRREIRAARLGPLGSPEGRLGGGAALEGKPVMPFVGRVQGGNSGGPIVDTRGRVLTTVFGQLLGRSGGFGVPNKYARIALRRAGPAVKPGDCDDHDELTGRTALTR
jgi:uncharacterized membrane protein required for colicin V production